MIQRKMQVFRLRLINYNIVFPMTVLCCFSDYSFTPFF